MDNGEPEIDLHPEDQEVEELLKLLVTKKQKVQDAKQQGIFLPIDEPTKYARSETYATPELRKKVQENIDRLTIIIMANGKESLLKEQGDRKYEFTSDFLKASATIPDPDDPYTDAPSEIIELEFDTDGRNDIRFYHDTRDEGVYTLSIIFSEAEEHEVSNIITFNSGETQDQEMRDDEAIILDFYIREAMEMIDPSMASTQVVK